MKQKILMTLALLITAVTGAWAQDHEYVDLGLPSGTLWATCNVGADSPEQYGGYFAFGEVETKSSYSPNNYKWASNPHEANTFTKYNHVDNLTVLQPEDDAATVNWGVQWRMPTVAEVEELIANCDITSTTRNNMTGYLYTSKINGETIFFPHAGYYDDNDLKFYGAGERAYLWTASVYENLGGMMFYNWYSVDGYCTKPASAGCGMTVRPVFNKDAVPVTTDAAQAGDFFTEATFAMPAFDATAEYELVRDLATSTKVDLIIGTGSDAVTATADTRLRIAKSNNVYAPISALSCNFVDQIENTTIAATAFADAKLTPQFYLQGENDAWTLVTDINTTTHLPNNLLPGQVYRLTLKAADGSYYDGETQPSYTVTLFEGYEVTIPAGEYITYYRDEPLKLDDTDKETIELYTIRAVGTETATLSGPYDAMKAHTPMLVHNKNTEEAKTILLIPCNEPDLALTVAPEFKGTLVATEIAASSATSNNYAFNGKQFVWVKDAIEVAANKAWLEVSNTNARTVTLVFDNTTRIDGAKISDALDGDYYDLNGRKLQGKPTKKGVYIQNGRKVVVK